MKHFFLVLLISISVQGKVFSQEKYDSRLLVKYSEKELVSIEKTHLEEYQFLVFCLDNAFYTADLPVEKLETHKDKIGKIEISDINNINFAALNITLKEENYQYYHIVGTDKMLIVKSINHIKKAMKNE